MTTPYEYDGIAISSRNWVAWLCLAVLFLAALTPAASLLLWAMVIPLCFVVSLTLRVAGVVDTEHEPSLPDFGCLLPSRAPPSVS